MPSETSGGMVLPSAGFQERINIMQIKTFNQIDPMGLAQFPADYSISETTENEDGILLRSAKLHDYAMPDTLLAIARAGSGIENIPVDRCTQQGICVFNTPGANANAVKELVICGLLIASRDVVGANHWLYDQMARGVEVSTVVEKGKKAFVGPEIYRKSLGIIGLGAIGSLVANTAVSLGMEVYGYDPYLSVDTALRLDHHVHVVKELDELYRSADYITVHIHVTDATRGLINAKAIETMKNGVRFINLGRGELVDEDAMVAALDCGKVNCYVTDFPNNRLLSCGNVVAMPHLGASTPESEQNCAVMAARELADYLENGNILHSVNLPDISLARTGLMRVCLIHKNIPAMLAGITTILSRDGANVEHLSNKSRGEVAYTILDLGSQVSEDVIAELKRIPGIIRVRVLH